jgi:CDP-glucose 4,6-dehydratase
VSLSEPSFWHGRRVLVTGHTGFKGSWLTLWLAHMGAEVTGYALDPPTRPSLFRLAAVSDCLVRSVHGDVRRIADLAGVVAETRPEVMFHLAAQSLVRQSYRQPVETYETNVMGTVHMLDTVRQVGGVRAVVVVTSDKCYQNNEWIWGYRESDPMGGFDPYSSSKGCAELVTSAYRSSFFPPERWSEHRTAVASVRAGNVLGGGDWATDRLVPDLMRGFIAGQEVKVRRPQATRPWQHVLEPLSGYLLLAERLWRDGSTHAEGWNFGPDPADARPVAWVADRLASQWGEGAAWVSDEDRHPHEATSLHLDWSKARLRLGWQPIWSLEEGLQRVTHWFKAHRQVSSASEIRDFTVGQIRDYMLAGGRELVGKEAAPDQSPGSARDAPA